MDRGDVDFAIVPIENSIEGSVGEAIDLLMKYPLKINAEIILRIVHCLISDPNASLNDIEIVYSHPQALGQCRSFLEKLNCKIVSVYDTAGSVKMIKNIKNAAAIASERAAYLYRMKILAKGIEDDKNNYTRFLLLSKNEYRRKTGNDKTTIIFKIEHKPGTLYRALEEFAERQINLTKIESRPVKGRPWEYFFYLDFEGHISDDHVKEAISALTNKVTFLKILGSYPKFREDLIIDL